MKIFSSNKVDIYELISLRRWSTLKSHIRGARNSDDKNSEVSSYRVLHYACQNHPPLDLVKLLCKTNPNAAFEKDSKRRSALHVACKNGCSPEVIMYILELNKNAASEFDIKNRSPFLLGYKSYVQKRGKSLIASKQDLYIVATALKDISPSSCRVKDCKGMNALKYARDRKLGRALIGLAK